MYNFTSFLKALLLPIMISIFSVSSFACIGVDDILINSSSVSGGNITYDISITLTAGTTAAFASITVPAGSTITDCYGPGGDCSSPEIFVFSGAVISATLTKPNDGDNIIINFAGRLSGALTPCTPSETFDFPLLASLPAELASFTGQAMDRVNDLKWETVSEENTMAFQVERSIDGRNFEVIGKVDASGFSEELRSYAYTDEAPSSLSYYRLQTVDLDGSFEYSDVLTIERTKPEIDLVEIFPVPAIGNEVTVLVHTKSEGTILMDLFDMTGRIVQQDRLELSSGINRVVLNLDNEANNLYFVTIYNGDERISKTILRSNLD